MKPLTWRRLGFLDFLAGCFCLLAAVVFAVLGDSLVLVLLAALAGLVLWNGAVLKLHIGGVES